MNIFIGKYFDYFFLTSFNAGCELEGRERNNNKKTLYKNVCSFSLEYLFN